MPESTLIKFSSGQEAIWWSWSPLGAPQGNMGVGLVLRSIWLKLQYVVPQEVPNKFR